MAFRILIVAALGALGGRVAQLYSRFAIAEHSMEPTLSSGDYVISSRRLDLIGLDDVVVFEHPDRAGMWLVKRVIGLPGDEVVIEDGSVYRNGRRLDGTTPGAGRWTVQAGALFVLGDARACSIDDSRTLGAIPIGLVEGRVVARYWPPWGIRRFGGSHGAGDDEPR